MGVEVSTKLLLLLLLGVVLSLLDADAVSVELL